MTNSDKPIRRVSSKKYRGAGDVVAAVAQPVANGLDMLFGTNLSKCSGCKKRREKLNKRFPMED